MYATDPALLDPYVESETEGVGNLTEMVTSYQACCPDSQIVLMGYSQGAQVTADFLCGRSEAGFTTTEAYASSVADAVSAIVLMGDPSFVKGLSWDRGNASNVSVCINLLSSHLVPFDSIRFISSCRPPKRFFFCSFFCFNFLLSSSLPVSASTDSIQKTIVFPSPRQRSLRARRVTIYQLL